MGKNLIQQKRGKGSPTYRAPSFRYIGKVKHRSYDEREKTMIEGRVIDLVTSAGHSAPIAMVRYDREEALMIAPHNMRQGDLIQSGTEAEAKDGNTLPLGKMEEGTLIYNIESNPGDGGKFCRSSGTAARILSKSADKVIVMLPSKKQKEFNPKCRATIGIVAGSGRKEKPLLKAGNAHYKWKAKNKLYPRVAALAMNAVDHPFGGTRSSKKGKVTIARRNAPPGAKVGLLRPRRTGRRR